MVEFYSMHLNIRGLGLIFYSKHAVDNICEGEDYLNKSFSDPDQVEQQVIQGKIVGVCTSSPGDYILKFDYGYPSDDELNIHRYNLRLGIRISDSYLYVRDLYDLMEWTTTCPAHQKMQIENGFYHITLLSNIPNSGIIGDHQTIKVYLNKLEMMPKLSVNGVPTLC